MSNSFYGQLWAFPLVEALLKNLQCGNGSSKLTIYATVNTTLLSCGWRVLQDLHNIGNNFVQFSRKIVVPNQAQQRKKKVLQREDRRSDRLGKN